MVQAGGSLRMWIMERTTVGGLRQDRPSCRILLVLGVGEVQLSGSDGLMNEDVDEE